MAQISALRFKALIMQGRACHAHSPLHVSPAVRAAPAGRDVGCRACCTRVRVKCSCLAMTTLAGPAIPQQRPTSDRRDRSPYQSAAKSCVHRGCHPSTLPQSRRSFQAVSVYICRFRGMQISDWALSVCVQTRAHAHTHTCVCACACCWMWITRCSSVQTRMHRKELKPWTARRDRRRNLCAPGWQQATRHAPGLDTPVPIESVGHGAAHFACCQI